MAGLRGAFGAMTSLQVYSGVQHGNKLTTGGQAAKLSLAQVEGKFRSYPSLSPTADMEGVSGR